jgi:hypothetical protein
MTPSSASAATFIAGIRGVTTGANDALAVLIDSNGQLGTTNSSRRVKTEDDGDRARLPVRAPDPEDFVDRRKQPGRRRRFRISVGEADTDRLGAIEQW